MGVAQNLSTGFHHLIDASHNQCEVTHNSAGEICNLVVEQKVQRIKFEVLVQEIVMANVELQED
jgi:hypothetical protein